MTSLFNSLFRHPKGRTKYADLMKLDDHLLNDIGLSRADIRVMMVASRAARKSARG